MKQPALFSRQYYVYESFLLPLRRSIAQLLSYQFAKIILSFIHSFNQSINHSSIHPSIHSSSHDSCLCLVPLFSAFSQHVSTHVSTHASAHASAHALLLLFDGPVDANLVVVDRFPLRICKQIPTYNICQFPPELAIVQAQCAVNASTRHIYEGQHGA